MRRQQGQWFAEQWIGAWNSHDLEKILEHYAEDVQFSSPFVRILADASGKIQGKAKLREYFRKGLTRFPELQFTECRVFVGDEALTLVYRSVNNLLAAETMFLNEQLKVTRVVAQYEQGIEE